MCGIVAAVSRDGGLDRARVAGAMAELRPRGPDGEGTWCSPGGHAVLGHTRLAVVGGANGEQPLVDHTGTTAIAVNGEFYGYRKLRRELTEGGYRSRTDSDSEILLHLYRRDGRRALEVLRGEFAFALWDERRRELFCARDRFGVKPLYYAEHAGLLYVASEIKALLACGVPARWDLAGYAAHLQIGLPAGATLFAGVRQLPPGCCLTAGERGLTVRRYWDLDYPTVEQLAALDRSPAALRRHVTDVRAAVDDAVWTRMVADVPLAGHLSGGVDSSSVVASAAEQGSVSTFTVGFADPALDESVVAARTADRLGLPNHRVDVTSGDLSTGLAATVLAGEMPQENSHGVARYLHSARIREHGFKAALAGEGGDELFAGYPQFQRDLAISLSPDGRARAAAGYRKLVEFGAPVHLRSIGGRLGFLPHWVIQRHLDVTRPVRPLLRPEFAATLDRADAVTALLADAEPQLADRSPLHQSSYLFTKTWLVNYILAAERLDAAHAVEVRLPLFDHHLFRVASAAPLEWYASGGTTKYVLREANRDRLSHEVYAATKRGFFAPASVIDDATLNLFRELATQRSMRDNPVYDQAAVVRLTDDLARRDPAERAGSERLLQLACGTGLLGDLFGMTTDMKQGD
jgi:asparagine synthase (glutamine-hydrolysing)